MKHKIYSAILLIVIVVPVAGQGINRLWGLTSYGGTTMAGTMFSTDGAGQNLITHLNFPEGIPGGYPAATKLLPYNGKLYGLTSSGGPGLGGIIFSWDPVSKVYKQEYAFQMLSEGTPYGSLVVKDGIFYGLASEGGEDQGGVLFSWDPESGQYSQLLSFSEEMGEKPRGSLTVAGDKLYGMTSTEGAYKSGTIFEYNPTTNTYSKLHDFSTANGASPEGDLLYYEGKFYGMTPKGGNNMGGVIFELDHNGAYRIIHHFAQGSEPKGSLVQHATKLFGMASDKENSGHGVLFALDMDKELFDVKHVFLEAEGSRPLGSLEIKGDKLYGMTSEGGTNTGGVIFEWDMQTGDYNPRYNFEEARGWKPEGSLFLFDGTFYGMTSAGGSMGGGGLFEWNPDTNDFTELSDFSVGELSGIMPLSNGTPWGGNVFATTSFDLVENAGTLFQWDVDSHQYKSRHVFSASEDGVTPYGEMHEVNGKFYGLTMSGGDHDSGVIFEWDAVTGVYRKRHSFSEEFEGIMFESFITHNGRFYGISSSYGSEYRGLLFEWDPNGNDGEGAFHKRFEFPEVSPESAAYPAGLTAKDDKIYGIAAGGGAHWNGVIFEWDPDQKTFSTKLDIEIEMGADVIYTGAMTLNDGVFYGTALVWDYVDDVENGILYKWDTNSFEIVHSFDNSDGMIPAGMLSVNNGKLYGVAIRGCSCEEGVNFVYEWDPARSTYTKRAELNTMGGVSFLPDFLLPFSRLVPAPVPVGSGNSGECVAFSILIDASNNEEWVPVTDAEGKAVAEINANGNILGNVTVSLFVNDGSVREDGSKRLYLDRNITISPEHADLLPDTKVDLRLYIRDDEFTALANADNSDGQPSGVSDIHDLALFKNEANDCGGTLLETALRLESSAENWNRGCVLQASVNSFSTFYFASSAYQALPVRLVDFKATIDEANGVLTWRTEEETLFSHVEIERSFDGKQFSIIGNRAAGKNSTRNHYTFTDPGVVEKTSGYQIYYRLRLVDLDERFTYSDIVAARLNRHDEQWYIYPNPTTETLRLKSKPDAPLAWQIVDPAGRRVRNGITGEGEGLRINVADLPSGIYHLVIGGQQKIFRFVKN